MTGNGDSQGDPPAARARELVTGRGAALDVGLVARDASELSQRSPELDQKQKTEEDKELGKWMDNLDRNHN